MSYSASETNLYRHIYGQYMKRIYSKKKPSRALLRLPRAVHTKTVRAAAVSETSLNAWISRIIEETPTCEIQTLSKDETQEILDIVINTLGPKKAGDLVANSQPVPRQCFTHLHAEPRVSTASVSVREATGLAQPTQ